MIQKHIRNAGLAILTFSISTIPILVFASDTFVPLTALPGLPEPNSALSLSDYLNSMYKVCIGVAATLAVIQIMRAGVAFMAGKGSVSGNEQGKALLQNAIFGLILVLSPAIVFGIINPKILDTSLDFSKLQPGIDKNNSNGTAKNPVPTQTSTYVDSDPSAESHCTEKGGTVTKLGPQEINCTLPENICPLVVKPSTTNIVGKTLESCCNKAGCKVIRAVKHTSCVCSSGS
jgi:type IV secretory pathway VirB2 component (pilin)